MHAKTNEHEQLITRKGKVPKIKFGTTETHDNIENVVITNDSNDSFLRFSFFFCLILPPIAVHQRNTVT